MAGLATRSHLTAMREALSSHLASSLQSREVAGERLRPRFATWSGTRTRFRSSINIWKKVRTVSLVKGGGRECGSRTSAQPRLQCTHGNVNNKHFVLNLSQFESPCLIWRKPFNVVDRILCQICPVSPNEGTLAIGSVEQRGAKVPSLGVQCPLGKQSRAVAN